MSNWKRQEWYLNDQQAELFEKVLELDLFDELALRIHNETCLTSVFTDVLATEAEVDEDEFHDSVQRALEIAEELIS